MSKGKQRVPKATGTRGQSTGPTAAQRRLAAQQAVAAASGQRSARQRRLLKTLSPVAAVLLVLVVLVAVKVAQGPDHPKSGAQEGPATPAVMTAVTQVPAATLNTIGAGTIDAAPKALTGAALTADGKPRVLFVGAEWCPYCAAERWPLAVALSHFGSLTGLGEVQSSSSDVYPSTSTLTFHGSSYTSSYISLTAKEICSNQVATGGGSSCNGYKLLDTLDAADSQLYQANGAGFPFLDVGGKYLFSASYDPSVLKGKSQAQIASSLADPSSKIAKAIDGAANLVTAAICSITSNKPASICSSTGVTDAASLLPNNG
jgi:hypothetical protein